MLFNEENVNREKHESEVKQKAMELCTSEVKKNFQNLWRSFKRYFVELWQEWNSEAKKKLNQISETPTSGIILIEKRGEQSDFFFFLISV